MGEFKPISPKAALDLFEAAGLGRDASVLIDYAEAGLVKGYARLTETMSSNEDWLEVRDSRIGREHWRRIVNEKKASDTIAGTVRLEGSGHRGGLPPLNLIGIRFDGRSVAKVAAQHGDTTASMSQAPKPKCPRKSAVSPPVQEPGIEAAQIVAVTTKAQVHFDEATVSASIDETGQILGVCRATVNNLISRKKLTSFKVGARTRITGDSIRAMISGGAANGD